MEARYLRSLEEVILERHFQFTAQLLENSDSIVLPRIVLNPNFANILFRYEANFSRGTLVSESFLEEKTYPKYRRGVFPTLKSAKKTEF